MTAEWGMGYSCYYWRNPNVLTSHMPQFRDSCAQRVSMATYEEDKIPLFLAKLWNIVEDPAYANIIAWDDSGYSFHITDPYLFCKNVLPQYFKHNNLNSLIRQLNMYGFRKTTPIDRTGLSRCESDHEHLEFSHPMFIRDHPELLSSIKRKSNTQTRTPTADEKTVSIAPKDFENILDQIRQLREKQTGMESKLVKVGKENQSLWQQVSHMRSIHMKQQQVVNKLVQFLVALVQPSLQNRVGKRHLLAIEPDELAPNAKSHRAACSSASSDPVQTAASSARPLLFAESISEDFLGRLQRELLSVQSPKGPIIAEVTDDPPYASAGIKKLPVISQSVIGQNVTLASREPPLSPTPLPQSPSPLEQHKSPPSTPFNFISPLLHTDQNNHKPQQQSQTDGSQEMAANLHLSPELDRQLSQDFGEYLYGIDQGLGNCRDLLINNGVQLDVENMEDIFSMIEDDAALNEQQEDLTPLIGTAAAELSSPSRQVALYQQRPSYFLTNNQSSPSAAQATASDSLIPAATYDLNYAFADPSEADLTNQKAAIALNMFDGGQSETRTNDHELNTPEISPAVSTQSLSSTTTTTPVVRRSSKRKGQ